MLRNNVADLSTKTQEALQVLVKVFKSDEFKEESQELKQGKKKTTISFV